MAIEEAIEGQVRGAATTALQTGGRLVVQVGMALAKLLANSTKQGIKTGGKKIGATVKEKVETGRMSEKRLQKTTGADLHEIKLDKQSLSEVTHSLRKSGVNYAVEKTGDEYFVHFQGKDLDHVKHSVDRAFDKLGMVYEPDQPSRKNPVETKAKEPGERRPGVKKTKKEFLARLDKKTAAKLADARKAPVAVKTKGKNR